LSSDSIGPTGINGSSLKAQHLWRLLELLASDGNRSQRELSHDLGAALGLTNQLLQSAVNAGWVRVVHAEGHRLCYELTRRGSDERRDRARRHMQTCEHAYAELRQHLSARLEQVIHQFRSATRDTRLVFYGGGSVTEVGYLCARGLGAEVIGRIGESEHRPLLDVPWHPPDALDRQQLAGQPFDCVVIMSFDGVARIRRALRARSVPDERIAAL
jgi:hypothetical protein